MKIRLYKPVSSFLLTNLSNDPISWEKTLSNWMGFKVILPRFFWEIHLYRIHHRLPTVLTMECKMEKDWFSVFYTYNLNSDLKKYIEVMLAKKCRLEKERAAHSVLRRAS